MTAFVRKDTGTPGSQRVLMAILINTLMAVVPGVAAFASAVNPTLSWTAPTANTNGTAITSALSYNLYQGAKGAEVLVASGVTSPYTASLASGLCFEVTAVESGVESARSNEVCELPSAPGAPTVH